MVALDLRHPGANGIAGNRALDEHDEPVEASDAGATVGQRVDAEVELLSLPDRHRHQAMLVNRLAASGWKA